MGNEKLKELVKKRYENGTKLVRKPIKHMLSTKELVHFAKDIYQLGYYDGLKAQGCPADCDLIMQAVVYDRMKRKPVPDRENIIGVDGEACTDGTCIIGAEG